jgi:hypothetical protein
MSHDPSSSSLCVMCARHFLGGSQGGAGMAPHGYTQCSTMGGSPGQCPEFFFWVFLLFFFAIFSGFLN